MRRTKIWTAVLAASLGAVALGSAIAVATHNRYTVDQVSIKVDRPARLISGAVLTSSTDDHFCTSGGDWPIRLRLVRPGKDKTIGFPKKTTFSRYRFRPPLAVKGKRVYAEVPSYPNSGHGYCVGNRSRTVTSP